MTAPVTGTEGARPAWRGSSPAPTGGDRDRPARRGMPPPIRGLRAAFVFLTRIPVGGFPYSSEDWKWAVAHAPVVGAAVGLAAAAVDRALAPAGEFPAAVLAIGTTMLLTGAFHEDGLADTSDALGGASDRERVFAILKDSRIGTFGAAALVISVVARAALVAELGGHAAVALVLSGAVARVVPVWLMAALPYVTDEQSAKSRAVLRGGAVQVLVATLWGALAIGLATIRHEVGLGRASVLVAVMAGIGALTGWRYRRRVGGITGDFLGATEQIAEIAALVVLAYGTIA